MLWLGVRHLLVDDCFQESLMTRTAAEYEFHQYKTPVTPHVPASESSSTSTARFLADNPPTTLTPITEGMFGYSLTRPIHNQEYYYGIWDACEEFKCDIEGWHCESGPGVYEAV